jgi:glycosyltransferase involved in cell wall biosynthesis
MTITPDALRILFWGTYDTGKPRTRILLRGLKENNVEVTEYHQDIWSAIQDKSQIKGLRNKIYFAVKIILSYPLLISKFVFNKKPDLIFIGYLGHIDIIILFPFAKAFGIPITWDPFISIYDTVVNDRHLISKNSLLSKIIYWIEYIACKCADLIVLDTHAHAQYFGKQYDINETKLCSVFVGVEPDFFPKNQYSTHQPNTPYKILFYGQFIPLHGINTIVDAAKLLEHEPVHFTLIGMGQESKSIDSYIDELNLSNITRIKWVSYENLIEYINTTDICLGIFGVSEKASRVIPNKVFQILASGKPLITMYSPAIIELIPYDLPKITLVKPGCAIELSSAIKEMLYNKEESYNSAEIVAQFTPKAIGRSLLNNIYNLHIKQ